MFISKSAALKEPAEERCCFIRDADNLVRCLTIEFEVELGLGSTVVPVGKKSELAPPQAPLGARRASDGMLTRGVCRAIPRFFAIALAEVTTPLATRPGPPSFSLAKTKIASPLAICLPPYIVFCALNANVPPAVANLGFDRKHHAPNLAPLIPGRQFVRPNENKTIYR